MTSADSLEWFLSSLIGTVGPLQTLVACVPVAFPVRCSELLGPREWPIRRSWLPKSRRTFQDRITQTSSTPCSEYLSVCLYVVVQLCERPL
jgi:hypothetical protein